MEVIKSFPENKISESRECAEILERNSSNNKKGDSSSSTSAAISAHFAMCLKALSVFGRLSSTLLGIRQLTPSTLSRLVQLTATIICVAFKTDESGDARHLSQYIQLVSFVFFALGWGFDNIACDVFIFPGSVLLPLSGF